MRRAQRLDCAHQSCTSVAKETIVLQLTIEREHSLDNLVGFLVGILWTDGSRHAMCVCLGACVHTHSILSVSWCHNRSAQHHINSHVCRSKCNIRGEHPPSLQVHPHQSKIGGLYFLYIMVSKTCMIDNTSQGSHDSRYSNPPSDILNSTTANNGILM